MKAARLILITLILIAANCAYSQKVLRTENGIVDLLEEEEQKQEQPYEENLSVFRLATPQEIKPRSLLSLQHHGQLQQVRTKDFRHLDNARKHIEAGNWDQAMQEINDGLALQPKNPELLRMAAITSTMLNDLYMANHYYDRYLEIDPDNVELMTAWARVLIKTYETEKATRLLDRAQELAPSYLPAKFYRVMLSIIEGGDEIDKRDWLKLSFSNKTAILNGIRSEREVYQDFLGSRGFKRFCNLTIGEGSADNLDQIYETIQTYRETGELEHLERLQELGLEGCSVPMERALTLFKNGDSAKALEITRELVDKYPEEPYILYNYGDMLNRNENHKKAEEVLRKSLDIAEQAQTKFALASALIMQDKTEEGWQLLFELGKEQPDKMDEWLMGDSPPLRRIRADRRYPTLCNMIGIPPESQ
ncbi:MAG: tetratricopeptide repeat protein [Desulfatiglandaceae bacterium]